MFGFDLGPNNGELGEISVFEQQVSTIKYYNFCFLVRSTARDQRAFIGFIWICQ